MMRKGAVVLVVPATVAATGLLIRLGEWFARANGSAEFYALSMVMAGLFATLGAIAYLIEGSKP